MTKVLVTGASGFIGRHLMRALAEEGIQAVGLSRSSAPGFLQISFDPILLRAVLESEKPDGIFHLAGALGSAPAREVYESNALGTAALFEAMLAAQKPLRTVALGSSAVYGNQDPSSQPLREDSPFHPLTIYGESKVVADTMGEKAFRTAGLPVIRVRPFNVIGPGQGAQFFVPKVASQLVEIENGQREPVLQLGNLDSYRDFVDVRDIARGLVLLWKKGEPGEAYHLSSGVATPIREAVEWMQKQVAVPVTINSPSQPSPTDVRYQCGDSSKILKACGWKTEISLEKTLQDVLDYWRHLKPKNR